MTLPAAEIRHRPTIHVVVTGLRTPRTDDMRAMLSDLHDAGACRIDWHGRTGMIETLHGVSSAMSLAAEQMRRFGNIVVDPPWDFRHAVR